MLARWKCRPNANSPVMLVPMDMFTRAVVMSAGFDGALEAVRIGAKTRTTKKEPSPAW